MNDIKKRVRLDENNKLVVEDNNAVTTIEGTTSKIEGVYEMDGEDVEKLLVLINDNTIEKTVYSYSFIRPVFKPNTQIITSDEAVSIVSKEYDELMEKYKELREEYNELNTECYELRNRHTTMKEKYDVLLDKVKKHNKNSLFNKIKIDELK